MKRAPEVVHVTSIQAEDHWSVQTLAKAVVPRREDRLGARGLAETRNSWSGERVFWWHALYFEEALRGNPSFPTGRTRNIVYFHHDRLDTIEHPDVHAAVVSGEWTENELGRKASVPVYRVHPGGAEDAKKHYDPSTRVTSEEKLWLGIIGGGGSRGRKGQRLLVPLAEELDPERYGWTFIGPHWGPWGEKLEDLGFEVFTPGYTRPGEQFVHFREVDVYLMLSLLEGIPLPLLEAMGCGIWPIATPTGIASEIVRDGVNGWLLSGWEVGEICAAIQTVDRDFLIEHRPVVAQSVSDWTWARFRSEVLRVMDCVFGAHSDRATTPDAVITESRDASCPKSPM